MNSEKAYAKINLHLEVLNKRSDGYHNIFSIMAALQLHDNITLYKGDLHRSYVLSEDIATVNNNLDCENSPGKIKITAEYTGKFAGLFQEVPDDKNLIFRAAKAYFADSNYEGEMHFIVEKNLPAGAGLGGGSADAAAVLRMLNRRYEFYDSKELVAIAKKLGADVPFCLYNGLAYCEGIGEIVEPIDFKLNHIVLLANPGLHFSTAEAYSRLDSRKNIKNAHDYNVKQEILEKKLQFSKLLNNRMLDAGNISFINDFEISTLENFALIEQIKKILVDNGAWFSQMTGSGSTVFGLFPCDSDLSEVIKKLSKICPFVHCTKFANVQTPAK